MRLTVLSILISLFALGCSDTGGYYDPYDPYPRGSYPSAYGGYDPDPYGYRDDYRYRNRDRYRDGYRDRDYEDDDDDDDGGRYKPRSSSPPPASRPAEQAIRPNCPSGTRFDGKSCIITDDKLRRPGGDGRINPCPKGMWLSGDRCVPG